MNPRKRKSGSMHLDVDGDPAQAESGMVMKRQRIAKVLVIDADSARCARIAGALPPEHVTFVAHETTLALALCVRESPTVVIAPADLGVMTLAHFISLVDYTGVGVAPRYVAYGGQTSVDPRVATVVPEGDFDALHRTVSDLIRHAPAE